MATFNKFNSFVQDIGAKKHNLVSDTVKVYLTNTVPVATNTVYCASGGVTNGPADLATGGGYVTTGIAISGQTWTNTNGLSAFAGSNVVFTATTGFGPFQYIVLYNDTATDNNLIGWYNYGTAVTLLASETFTVDFTTNATIFTLG